ncbi:hypothetical protein P4U05_24200 [Bacillus paranthracis]|uniref:hypothetical protein n=1 Tax=Bacillus cereus group TaxID=86661 RepID=UPI00059CA316|nr:MULTISPECIES: hypothetical protein [Bacillus cereus group]MRC73710.1 hypothetical protein [Bacillus thuringiensis]OTX68802.1 hypothetical protein BK722_19530 [Bacillus thuringiensis serovar finitimus]MCR6799224.1 hypothetical protein [Bacillus paranthracis]MEC3358617.1 hypothetical protein [Bacillus paranthracis]MED0782399.1 hypothetical protein [Bacillus paranthracis]
MQSLFVNRNALNTPSKEQEQMLETSSQDEQNSNNNANKKDVTQGLSGKDFPISTENTNL